MVRAAAGAYHIPSVFRLQELIDAGGAAGYDPPGRAMERAPISGTDRMLSRRELLLLFRHGDEEGDDVLRQDSRPQLLPVSSPRRPGELWHGSGPSSAHLSRKNDDAFSASI